MIDKYKVFEDKVAALKKDGVYRDLPVNSGACTNVINLNGKRVINLSSNNYLGLATNKQILDKANQAAAKYGTGAGSVRTIVGNTDLLEELEEVLAKFKQEEAVTVFQSGLNCNIGTIQAITEKGDLIISDELNHASIIDGVRLSKADKAVYRHNDMLHLEEILASKRDSYNTVLIITDGVFSMDGDIADLKTIVSLAKKYNALTYVDDAHGSGVLGRNGRGTVDHLGLHGEVDFIVGTLSKAVGSIGGYVTSKKIVKEWLLHRCRPILFSTALPPASIASSIEAINILMQTDEYTNRLWSNAKYFKNKMKEIGFDLGHSQTPITPVMVGDEALTMKFSKMLQVEGVFASAIVFPTVPVSKGRLRVMISAAHSIDDLDYAIMKFESVAKKLNII